MNRTTPSTAPQPNELLSSVIRKTRFTKELAEVNQNTYYKICSVFAAAIIIICLIIRYAPNSFLSVVAAITGLVTLGHGLFFSRNNAQRHALKGHIEEENQVIQQIWKQKAIDDKDAKTIKRELMPTIANLSTPCFRNLETIINARIIVASELFFNFFLQNAFHNMVGPDEESVKPVVALIKATYKGESAISNTMRLEALVGKHLGDLENQRNIPSFKAVLIALTKVKEETRIARLKIIHATLEKNLRSSAEQEVEAASKEGAAPLYPGLAPDKIEKTIRSTILKNMDSITPKVQGLNFLASSNQRLMIMVRQFFKVQYLISLKDGLQRARTDRELRSFEEVYQFPYFSANSGQREAITLSQENAPAVIMNHKNGKRPFYQWHHFLYNEKG